MILRSTLALALLAVVMMAQASEHDAFRASLGEAERAWLAAHPVIRIAFDNGNPPMNFRDGDGRPAGITLDYLAAIEARLGIRIEPQGMTWEEGLARAMAHEVDGIANAYDKPERRSRLDFTAPYFVSPLALAMRRGIPAPERLEEFQGSSIAVVEGSARVGLLRRQLPGVELVEVPNLQDCFAAVTTGRADALLDDLVVVSYTMQTEFYANLQIGLLYHLPGYNESRFGLRNDWPLANTVFDRAIADITAAEHQAIADRWLRNVEAAHQQRALALSDAERAWLADHPVVRVAIDPYWPPYEFFDAGGRPRGLAIDYMVEVERRLGIEFRILEGYSWAELIELAKRGEVDCFSCVAPTPERDRYLDFSQVYFDSPVVLFGRSGSGWVNDLAVLDGRQVGVVAGYAVEDWLRSNHPRVRVVPVNDIDAGIDALNRGSIDWLMANSLVGTERLTERGFHHLTVVGETPYRNAQAFGVREDWPLLVTLIDKALASIPRERRSAIAQRWVSPGAQPRPDLSILWWSLGLGAAVVVLVVLWNANLRRVVQARTAALTRANAELHEQIEARSRVENQLVQAQKMDAIGQLAGGIAHDFNNMLAGISGAAELLAMSLGDHPQTRRSLEIIRASTQRAADLTSKLLAFGRQGQAVMRPIDLHVTIEGALAILERTIDPRIRIEREFAALAHVVQGDATLLQNAVLNLGINARDAMPDGGVLSIRTGDRRVGSDHPALPPGLYIQIDVMDSGSGIDAAIAERIFEPFFTTKDVGKGTGLGLSAVYGTIRDHGGGIRVANREGGGAHFEILLPASPRDVESSGSHVAVVPGGEGLVLLVDDEPLVRESATMLLQQMGYTVISAADGEAGLALWRQRRSDITAVILDMVMPKLSGEDCARAILAEHPSLRIVLCSGYTQPQTLKVFDDYPGLRFLTKPYSGTDLACALAAIGD